MNDFIEDDDLPWVLDERALCEGVDPDELTRVLRWIQTKQLATRILAEKEDQKRPPVLLIGKTLDKELADGVPPISYTIDRIHPAGSNTLLTAQYKTGKTTSELNLAHALADGLPFLGSFAVQAPLGRIGYWNYEMNQSQMLNWAGRLDIKNADRIMVEHLRGKRLSLLTPRGQDEAVRWLEHWEVQFWIIDTFRRAFQGVSSNDNDEVERFLEALDIIKERAGVPDLLLSAHTGRMQHGEGEERARGATALDDWPDARWLLTRGEGEGDNVPRFFRAEGRDVHAEEQRLSFDPSTLHLTLGSEGRAASQRRNSLFAIVNAVADKPGIGKKDLETAIGGHKNDRAPRIAEAVGQELVEVRLEAQRKQAHHLTTKGERFAKSGVLSE